jgi:hypothetical protein
MIDKPVILNRNSADYRALLWKALCIHGDPAQESFVICNLCSRPVSHNEDWHESHIGAPKALGGIKVGIAHKLCNLEDGRTNVVPFVARANRMQKTYLGTATPSDTPLPFGRKSALSKTLKGPVVPRLSQTEKHQLLMAQRWQWSDWE